MPKWSKQANEALSRVPFFVRKRVKKRVEEEAARSKAYEVTIEHVHTCQKRFLNRMEDEVKGFQVETCSRPQIVDIGLIGACRPEISDKPCSQCGECVEVCKENAVSIKDDVPVVDDSKCLYCGQCIRVCPTGSLKEAQEGYRILVGGKLGRHPRLATEIPGIYQPGEALAVIERCLDHYQHHCLKGERFGEILERTPLLHSLLAPGR